MSLEAQLLAVCREKNLTLSLAESCTGGALAARITTVAGASHYFLGSIVSYSAFAKIRLLQVSGELLKQHSPVSERVAEAMVQGALKVFESDVAVAITGVAGPTGGTAETPVGTVIIAVAKKAGITRVYRFQMEGDRIEVINGAVTQALETLLGFLGHKL